MMLESVIAPLVIDWNIYPQFAIEVLRLILLSPCQPDHAFESSSYHDQSDHHTNSMAFIVVMKGVWSSHQGVM